MSVSILVLVIFCQCDEALSQSLDIGRPKLEKQTTTAGRIKKWRQNLSNKVLENNKKAKYQNKATKLTEQLEKEREKARNCIKAFLREKQKEHLVIKNYKV